MKNRLHPWRAISQEQYIIWSRFSLHWCKMISPEAFFVCSEFWFFRLLVRLKDKKWSKVTKYSVCRAPYLKEKTLCDFHIWYTCLKLWYLLGFFHFFKILIFGVVVGVKVQKIDQNHCHVQYFRSHTSYNCHLWYTSVKW